MFRTQCGTFNTDEAQFCGGCGTPSQATASVRATAITAAVPQIRPWVRYWARCIDLTLFALVASIFIAAVAPHALDSVLMDIALQFVWIFVESLLLSTFGTTPGKSFFKVKLSLPTASTIPYSFALSRSIKVWWRDLGAGLPIVTHFTLAVAYSLLLRNGFTSWDKEGGIVIIHERIGVGRAIAAIGFFIIAIVLIAAGSAN